ncbi:DUF6678 family protein [Hymenobacter cavernae]|uniref:Uncharacterized protein n=1 Tax=Hymenobacter cavernae TaxID=2044852 RepID=A0ABQ1U0B4_9BACT|nr:DUF6678 family protein [Hymenobacter cavernae]GGF05969.1 hypothetical protein GCM10011383_16390 [Hymenobacter cavernae]
MKIKPVIDAIDGLGCQFRLKLSADLEPESWGQMLISPVDNYVEINGPWPLREVEWIEVNPIVKKHIGRLVKPQVIDYTSRIATRLNEQCVSFSIEDGMIRVPISAS